MTEGAQNNTLIYIYNWCLEHKILASLVDDFLVVEGKPVFCGNHYYGNNAVSTFLARSKKSTQLFLSSLGISILEQENFVFMGENALQNIIDIKKWATERNFNVVLKPNNGSQGKDVYKISTEKDFMEKLSFLNLKYGHANISPFLDVRSEYRFFVFDHKVEVVYKKRLVSLFGDGKKTFYELLQNQVSDIKDFIRTSDNSSFSLADVVPLGKEVVLGWKFRLDNKEIQFDLFDLPIQEIHVKEILTKAEEVSQHMNLSLCSVDFYELNDGSFVLNEINSGFMIENLVKFGPRAKNQVDLLLRKIFSEFTPKA